MGDDIENAIRKFYGKTTLHVADFVELFEKYDKDANGYIEKGELDNFLKDICDKNCGLSKSELEEYKQALLKKHDENFDGRLSMNELAKILPTDENFLMYFKSNKPLHIVDFMKIWYHYDADKTGYLEINEMKGFLKDLVERNYPQEMTPEKIQGYLSTILQLFDVNKDMKIGLGELSQIVPVENNFLAKFQEGLTKEDFEKIFSHYDQDNSGFLQDTELAAFLKDLLERDGKKRVNAADLENYRESILQIADVNKEGKLSKSELSFLLAS